MTSFHAPDGLPLERMSKMKKRKGVTCCVPVTHKDTLGENVDLLQELTNNLDDAKDAGRIFYKEVVFFIFDLSAFR